MVGGLTAGPLNIAAWCCNCPANPPGLGLSLHSSALRLALHRHASHYRPTSPDYQPDLIARADSKVLRDTLAAISDTDTDSNTGIAISHPGKSSS